MEELQDHVSQLRKEYIQGALEESQAQAEPLAQFQTWLEQALTSEVPEPHAMSLATADASGRPSLRVVLLRGFDAKGFVFFTNYGSRKGRDLEQNPYAALAFYWPELERQIRIEGTVCRTSEAESDAYFQSRPRESRIGAWASPQSEPIEDRQWLELQVNTLRDNFEGEDVHRPEGWGGFRLSPERFEFWQGRASRLHDRLVYVREGKGWRIERLAP